MSTVAGNGDPDVIAAVSGSAEPALVAGRGGRLAYANDAAVRLLGYDRFDELRGRPGHETLHHKRPDGSPLPAAECTIGHHVRHDQDWFVRRDGRMLPISYRAVPVDLAGEPGLLVGFADTDDLRAQRRELRRHAAVLATIGQPVYVADHEGIARYANRAALSALGYRDLAEIEGHDGHLLLHDGHADPPRHRHSRCPLAGGVALDEPVSVGEDSWARADGAPMPVTYSAAPIELPRGRGVLVVFRPLSRERASELHAIRRRILEAADDARRELARDLHDGAQQRFVAAVTTLRRARQACGDDAPHARELIDLALEQATEGIEELRNLAAGLHPAILVHRGLGAAVEALADVQPLPVKVSNRIGGRLPEGIESGVYFLVSEALTNVIKHSDAHRAEASLACDGTALLVEIRDDGVGGAPSGDGLPASLAARVAALDGTLEVSSPPGGGTTVQAVVPIQ